MEGHDITLTMEGRVDVFGKHEVIESIADEMMGHLLACDVIVPSISEAYDDSEEHVRLEITMSGPLTDPAEAVRYTMTAVRSAFHAANVGTPGWEDLIARLRHTISASSDGDLPARG